MVNQCADVAVVTASQPQIVSRRTWHARATTLCVCEQPALRTRAMSQPRRAATLEPHAISGLLRVPIQSAKPGATMPRLGLGASSRALRCDAVAPAAPPHAGAS
jgi:hypothetical protein